MREMTLTSERILLLLDNTQWKYEKLYCYPSVKTIQKNLGSIYGIHKCTRQIFRSLKWLDDHEYLERTPRVSQPVPGQWRQKTTLYKLLGKTYRFLEGMARWVKHRINPFRVTFKSHHKRDQGSIIRSDYPEFPKEEERPPPDTLRESFKKGFEDFKRFCESL